MLQSSEFVAPPFPDSEQACQRFCWQACSLPRTGHVTQPGRDKSSPRCARLISPGRSHAHEAAGEDDGIVAGGELQGFPPCHGLRLGDIGFAIRNHDRGLRLPSGVGDRQGVAQLIERCMIAH